MLVHILGSLSCAPFEVMMIQNAQGAAAAKAHRASRAALSFYIASTPQNSVLRKTSPINLIFQADELFGWPRAGIFWKQTMLRAALLRGRPQGRGGVGGQVPEFRT